MHRLLPITAALIAALLLFALFTGSPTAVPPAADVFAYPVPPGVSTPTDEPFPPTLPPGPTQGVPPTPPPGVSTPSPTFDPHETPPPGVSTPTATIGPVYLPLVIEPDS